MEGEEEEGNQPSKRPKKSSPMHEQGLIITQVNGKVKWKCNLCDYYCMLSGNSSSNAMLHLKKHDIFSSNSLQKARTFQNLQTIEEMTLDQLAVENNVTKERFCNLQRALVTIEKLQDFNYYESNNVRLSQPGFRPISAKAMQMLVLEDYHAHFNQLRNELQTVKAASSLPSFHLMIDLWLEKHNQKDFFGIRLSYIDLSFHLQSRFILLSRYHPSYMKKVGNRASDLIHIATKNAIATYNLDLSDIYCSTSDKGPDVYCAITKKMCIDHIWCLSHLLNRVLASSIGKKSPVSSFLQSIRNTINTINLSDYNHTLYEELNGLNLPSDVKERWKSSMVMMRSVLLNFNAIEITFTQRGIACPLTNKRHVILEVYSIVKKITDLITSSQNTSYNPCVECVLTFMALFRNHGIFNPLLPIELCDPVNEGKEDIITPIISQTNLSDEANLVINSIKKGLKKSSLILHFLFFTFYI